MFYVSRCVKNNINFILPTLHSPYQPPTLFIFSFSAAIVCEVDYQFFLNIYILLKLQVVKDSLIIYGQTRENLISLVLINLNEFG